jgi:hypothetical protein
MQRAVFQRALLPSPSRTFGSCIIITAPTHRKRLHTRRNATRPPTPHQVRAVSSSSSSSTLAAPSLSTIAVADATRNAPPPQNDGCNNDDASIIYVGPLTNTFRRLKIFSLSSLALASTLSPFIFIVESSLPSTARAALAATALATSGVSTALVAWCGRPYVTTLRRLTTSSSSPSPSSSSSSSYSFSSSSSYSPSSSPTLTTTSTVANTTTSEAQQPQPQQQPSQQTTHSHNENAPAGIELTTLTLTLKPRMTRVYDPVFLCDTPRAFARWELARGVQLPPEDAVGVRPGAEETVAETLDGSGRVLGRWIVTWAENGEGSCRAEGRVET